MGWTELSMRVVPTNTCQVFPSKPQCFAIDHFCCSGWLNIEGNLQDSLTTIFHKPANVVVLVHVAQTTPVKLISLLFIFPLNQSSPNILQMQFSPRQSGYGISIAGPPATGKPPVDATLLLWHSASVICASSPQWGTQTALRETEHRSTRLAAVGSYTVQAEVHWPNIDYSL